MRFQSLGQEDPWEEGMAAHSRMLAWRIPWTEEPGGLQSTGHKELDNVTKVTEHVQINATVSERRKWQHTPVFLPGESQGWGRLVGCLLWGCTELDTTE